MRPISAACLTALIAVAPPWSASAETDFSNLSTEERSVLRDTIRAVLAAQPALLPNARPAPAPSADSQYADAVTRDLARIKANATALFSADLPGFGASSATTTIALFTAENCADCARAKADLQRLTATHDLRVTLIDMAHNRALVQRLELDIAPSYVFPKMMLRGHIPPIVLKRYLTE